MHNLKINFYKILKLSRPRFWFYIAGTFFVGFAYGINSIYDLDLHFLILFLYFLIPANLLVYSINDLVDEEVDSVNSKKDEKEIRVDNSNRILVKKAFYISLFLSLLIMGFLRDEVSVILFIIFLFFGIFYSVPPFRFKTKVFLDFFSNAFYIIPGIIGFYEASAGLPNIAYIISGVLWAFAMHLFSAVVDIEADRKANITTSATYLGKNKSLLLCLLFWGLAWMLVWYKGVFDAFIYLYLLYPLLPVYMLINKKADLEKLYWFYPYINLILGFLLFILAIF